MSARRNAAGLAFGSMAPPPPPLQQHLELSQHPPATLPPSSAIVEVFRKHQQTAGSAAPTPDAYHQMLSELLLQGSDNPTSTSDGEDTVVNYQLIVMLVTYGLCTLLQEDPFGAQTEIAGKSLQVLRAALVRTPQVLFCPPPQTAGIQTEQPFLYLWLFPRIMPLLGQSRNKDLRPELLDTVQTIFGSAIRNPKAWKHLKVMLAYLKSCMVCILATIQNPESLKNVRSSMELPAIDFAPDSDASKEAESPLNIRALSFTIGNREHAVTFVVDSFTMLNTLILSSVSSKLLQFYNISLLSAQQILLKIWTVLPAWAVVPGAQHVIVSSLRLQVVKAIEGAVDRLAGEEQHGAPVDGTFRLAIRCLGSLLRSAIGDKVLEHTACALILSLLHVRLQYPFLQNLLQVDLIPVATRLLYQPAWVSLDRDTQLVLLRLIIDLSEDDLTEEMAQTRVEQVNGSTWDLEDKILQAKLKCLSVHVEQDASHEAVDDGIGPRKRRRLTNDADENREAGNLIAELDSNLRKETLSNIVETAQKIVNNFATLSENDQCAALKGLGLLACHRAESTELMNQKSLLDGDIRCKHCDNGLQSARKIADSLIDTLFSALCSICDMQAFSESFKIRGFAMDSLRRLLRHTTSASYLNVTEHRLGKWCLESLKSSRRELRISAGRSLPCYLNLDLDEDLLKNNRLAVMGYLQSLFTEGEAELLETCVMAWGQVGRVSEYIELELVLARMIEFLADSRIFIVGVAQSELQILAQVHECSPRSLLAPFWRTLSPTVVKNLVSNPQQAASLCEVMSMELDEFLRLTQGYTMPYMILWKKEECVNRIAEANRSDEDKLKTVLRRNMVQIFSVVLSRLEGENIERRTKSVIESAFPHFDRSTWEGVLNGEALEVIVEVLQLAGDENELGAKQKCYNVLKPVAAAVARTKNQSSMGLAALIDQNILGVCWRFREVINTTGQKHGYLMGQTLEKIRCLKAFKEMIPLAKEAIKRVIPQITACLQLALESPALQGIALDVWATLLDCLPKVGIDIRPLLGLTFCILLQLWDQFRKSTKAKALEMVKYLFTQQATAINDVMTILPSLESIPEFADFEMQNKERRDPQGDAQFLSLIERCQHDNSTVVEQALKELLSLLEQTWKVVLMPRTGEKKNSLIPKLLRCLLDVNARFKDPENPAKSRIEQLCGASIGLIGASDPNKIDAERDKPELMVLGDYESNMELAEFIRFLLDERLVNCFLSLTEQKAQSRLSWAMQELLRMCGITHDALTEPPDGVMMSNTQKWWSLLNPKSQDTLEPFVTSKFSLTDPGRVSYDFPIFTPDNSFRTWIHMLLLDMMTKCRTGRAGELFGKICPCVVKFQDTSISTFLLPFVALYLVMTGNEEATGNLEIEFLTILRFQDDSRNSTVQDRLLACSDAIFLVVDHFSRWLRDKKKKERNHNRLAQDSGIRRVEVFLSKIPPDLTGLRALACKSYERALFYWEQHIRQCRTDKRPQSDMEPMYRRLQQIYTNIDEPDGIEGLSMGLELMDMDQQVLEDRKAGRWQAPRAWYEGLLNESPGLQNLQLDLVNSLKESCQYSEIVRRAEQLTKDPDTFNTKILPSAVEAACATGEWRSLDKFLALADKDTKRRYELRLGQAFAALCQGNDEAFTLAIAHARQSITSRLVESNTITFRQCHDPLVKLHVLSEIETLAFAPSSSSSDLQFRKVLDHRLELLGTYSKDKQYILALRRSVLSLSDRENPSVKDHLVTAWVQSARLSRKDGQTHTAYQQVLSGSAILPALATVELAKLLWISEQPRRAIQNLQTAIEGGCMSQVISSNTPVGRHSVPEDLLQAKASLRFVRWLDGSSQTAAKEITARYSKLCKKYPRWEKSHYYFARHYDKLLEAESQFEPERQSRSYVKGEILRHVCQNYLRSLAFGSKYIFHALPRTLTLWLDFGEDVGRKPSPEAVERYSNLEKDRLTHFTGLQTTIKKYFEQFPPWLFFTAFAQIISRIAHTNDSVAENLKICIVRVVEYFPQAAMWSIMPICRSTQKLRKQRGDEVLAALTQKKCRAIPKTTFDQYIRNVDKFISNLLNTCNYKIPDRTLFMKLKVMGYNANAIRFPLPLVLPMQAALSVSLPSPGASLQGHVPFTTFQPYIQSIDETTEIMVSLQKPRKLKILGTDGNRYSFLLKPNDDLRKDQRLMEFNSMINRMLKRDPASNHRTLSIRTYQVTPLDEKCGMIEWVNGLVAFRNIITQFYKVKNVVLDYGFAKKTLEECCQPDQLHLWEEKLLAAYPSVFHEWFVEVFSEPSAWFAARLRYTRSSAVISMVGTILGLGDRHGENIMFDDSNGETVHVDFNCLFDKGRTFEKPERVPFRLTRQLVDAMGVTGYEGVFRKTSEIAMAVLRHNQENLLTILETFLHDPAVDMTTSPLTAAKKTKKDYGHERPHDSPRAVLEIIKCKLNGLVEGESVPLSVEGYVAWLIREATKPENLAPMYVGWCPFL